MSVADIGALIILFALSFILLLIAIAAVVIFLGVRKEERRKVTLLLVLMAFLVTCLTFLVEGYSLIDHHWHRGFPQGFYGHSYYKSQEFPNYYETMFNPLYAILDFSVWYLFLSFLSFIWHTVKRVRKFFRKT